MIYFTALPLPAENAGEKKPPQGRLVVREKLPAARSPLRSVAVANAGLVVNVAALAIGSSRVSLHESGGQDERNGDDGFHDSPSK